MLALLVTSMSSTAVRSSPFCAHHHHLLKRISQDKTSLQQLLIEFSEEKKLPAGVQSLHSDQSADRLSDRLTFPCHTQHHLFTFCSFVDFDFLEGKKLSDRLTFPCRT